MTTSQSPLRVLKAQASLAAKNLKRMANGEPVKASEVCDPWRTGGPSLKRPTIKFAVVMDDKIVAIEMPWSMIRETGEVALAEYILRYMRDTREATH
jgi:hypothetical protein